MNCECCQREHEGTYGSGRFCSSICAHRREISAETKEKQRQKTLNWIARKKEQDPIWFFEYQTKISAANKKNQAKMQEARLQKALAKSWEDLGVDARRKRVLQEQNHTCNNCGISTWQGFTITLELEHKDGNHQNNSRENLEALCPNCHSITDTWRGRNKRERVAISDEDLLAFLRNSASIRLGLIAAGLSPRGGNYKRAKRLLAL